METLACRCFLGPSRGKLRDLLAEAVCLCALEGGGLLERLFLANQGFMKKEEICEICRANGWLNREAGGLPLLR